MEKHEGHESHLCKRVIGDQATVEEIKPLINNPQYICTIYKRAANNKGNLCVPESL